MRKIITTSVCIGLAILLYVFATGIRKDYRKPTHDQTPTPDLTTPSFSPEANEIFISSIADHGESNSSLCQPDK
jgi:hypothetical protein